MTDDVFPVAELDAPSAGQPAGVERAMPFLWTAVAVLLMTAVAAAVLGWADEESPAERVAAAGAVAGAEDFAYEATMEAEGLQAPSGYTFAGAVDGDTGRTRGAGLAGGAASVEFITDGTIQYLKLPPELGGGGPPWIRFDLAELGVPVPSNTNPTSNPIDALRQLDAIVGDITKVGVEDVRGEETTHFRFAVDVVKTNPDAAAKLPADVQDGLRRVPMDLWLDDQDRPRRLRQALDLGPDFGTMTTTVELFDFDKAVTIDLPPADQVRDVDLTDPAGLGALLAPAPAS